MLAAALILTSLAGGDDDDVWALNQAAFMANRMRTEIGVFLAPVAPMELLRILESPTAVTTTIEDLIAFSKAWTWWDEIEAGKYKDWTNFQKYGFRLMPGTKPLHNFLHPEESMKFYTR
jgi:hypothetical protein